MFKRFSRNLAIFLSTERWCGKEGCCHTGQQGCYFPAVKFPNSTPLLNSDHVWSCSIGLILTSIRDVCWTWTEFSDDGYLIVWAVNEYGGSLGHRFGTNQPPPILYVGPYCHRNRLKRQVVSALRWRYITFQRFECGPFQWTQKQNPDYNRYWCMISRAFCFLILWCLILVLAHYHVGNCLRNKRGPC